MMTKCSFGENKGKRVGGSETRFSFTLLAIARKLGLAETDKLPANFERSTVKVTYGQLRYELSTHCYPIPIPIDHNYYH